VTSREDFGFPRRRLFASPRLWYVSATMSHRLHVIFLLALCGVSVSCRGCYVAGPTDVRDLLPEDAALVVYVPKTGLLVRDVAAFVHAATKKAGATLVDRVRLSAKDQLGFYPLDPHAYATMGIAGDQGLVAFVPAGKSEVLVAISVKKSADFDRSLADLVEKIDGANKQSVEKIHGVEVHQIGRPFGAETVPVLCWTYLGAVALVARAGGKQLLLDTLAAWQNHLARSNRASAFAQHLDRVPASDVVIFGRPSPWSRNPASAKEPFVGTAITSWTASAEGLRADAVIDLGHDISLPEAPPALPLFDQLPQDAVVVAVSQTMRPALFHALASVPIIAPIMAQMTTTMAKEAGLNLEADVMPQMAGAFSAAVTIVNVDELAQMARTRTVPRELVLDAVQVEMHAKLNSAAKFVDLLRSSTQALMRRGVKIRQSPQTMGGLPATVFVPDHPGPAHIGWAVLGDQYHYGAGVGRLDLVLKQAGRKSGSGLAGLLRQSVAASLASTPGVSVLVLRTGALVSSLRPFAQTADQQLGVEAGTASISSMIQGGLDVVQTLGDIAIGVDFGKSALHLLLRERLQ
jgi:hypothetical protein